MGRRWGWGMGSRVGGSVGYRGNYVGKGVFGHMVEKMGGIPEKMEKGFLGDL